MTQEEAAKKVNSMQKGMGSFGKPDYEVGDRVSHVKFGEGVVLSLVEGAKDYQVSVDFDNFGKKVMYAGFAKLKKI